MIKVIKEGTYTLIETKNQIKILTLDRSYTLAWVWAKEIGEILITSYNPHKIDHILAVGNYKIYEVTDEPELVDLMHIELAVGHGKWQSYLLPTGLPDDTEKRKRVIPTKEVITKRKSTSH